jgi:APA family basic amino acid/polyamine antiporter
MAKRGHFFRFASKVHPRTHAPYLSIIIQSVIAIIMVMSGTFDQILTFMGFSLGIFPIIAVIGVFKLRFSGKSKIKMPGYPYVPGLYIFIAIVILLLAFFERPVESSIAIGTVVVGIPAYYLFSGAAKNKNVLL